MKPVRDDAVRARVRATLDLFEVTESMMRQNLRRRFPRESEDEIEVRLLEWLRDRPGAKHGDAGGSVRVRRLSR